MATKFELDRERSNRHTLSPRAARKARQNGSGASDKLQFLGKKSPHSDGEAGEVLARTDLPDEEMARRLHEQLNGPSSPTVVTRHRLRKAPTFYTPQQLGGYGGYHCVEFGSDEDGAGKAQPPPAKRTRKHASPTTSETQQHQPHVKEEAKTGKHAAEGLPHQPAKRARQAAEDADDEGEGEGHRHAASRQHAAGNATPGSEHEANAAAAFEDQNGDAKSDSGPKSSSDEHAQHVQKQQKQQQQEHQSPLARELRALQKDGLAETNGSRHADVGSDGEAQDGREGGSGSIPTPSRRGLPPKHTKGSPQDSEEGGEADAGGAAHKGPSPPSTSADSGSEGDTKDTKEDQAGSGSGEAAQQGPTTGRRLAKIPKLPMVRHGKKWYRARLLKDNNNRVLIEFAGFEQESAPVWLPKESDRIWRGSYKGKDWRHLGDGAWEPKQKAKKCKGKGSSKDRSRKALGSNHEASSCDNDHSEPDLNTPRASQQAMDFKAEEAKMLAAEGQDEAQPDAQPGSARSAQGHHYPDSATPRSSDTPRDGKPLPSHLQAAVKPDTPDAAAKAEEEEQRQGSDGALAPPVAKRGSGRRKAFKGRGKPHHPDGSKPSKELAGGQSVLANESSPDGHGPGLECEEALPAEEPQHKAEAVVKDEPDQQMEFEHKHLGWKGAWKGAWKKTLKQQQADSGQAAAGSGGSAAAGLEQPSPRVSQRVRVPPKREAEAADEADLLAGEILDNSYDGDYTTASGRRANGRTGKAGNGRGGRWARQRAAQAAEGGGDPHNSLLQNHSVEHGGFSVNGRLKAGNPRKAVHSLSRSGSGLSASDSLRLAGRITKPGFGGPRTGPLFAGGRFTLLMDALGALDTHKAWRLQSGLSGSLANGGNGVHSLASGKPSPTLTAHHASVSVTSGSFQHAHPYLFGGPPASPGGRVYIMPSSAGHSAAHVPGSGSGPPSPSILTINQERFTTVSPEKPVFPAREASPEPLSMMVALTSAAGGLRGPRPPVPLFR
ncbi:hypothetical protein WJX72_011216 [[Myrmecia] bisecta]|uniref:Uncharacterized protein n=1 Tax=[Myrmecia] bisecta TaxID=41462 RepID=A0AAW1R9Y3_9CHLO